MIIFARDIIWTFRVFTEDIIMSVVTAIFQAIFQVISTVFPISESAHSAMYHCFSNTLGSDSTLTGAVHIGIALGIYASLYKLFIRLFGEFILGFKDLRDKTIKDKITQPARKFLYFLLLSFVPLILWVIPCGNGRLLYDVLKSTATNNSLLEEGILISLVGALVFVAMKNISKEKNNAQVGPVPAILVGFANMLAFPVSGLSPIGITLCVLLLLGASPRQSFNFAFASIAPVILVSGIVELVTNDNKSGVVSIILGLVISVILSFFAVRIFRFLVKNKLLKHIAIYDLSFGFIASIIGVFQLILK